MQDIYNNGIEYKRTGKLTKIVIVILAVLIPIVMTALIMVISLVMIYYENKVAISENEFLSIMVDNGFMVEDMEKDESIEKALIAYNDDFAIEFHVYEYWDFAKRHFEYLYKDYNLRKKDNYSQNESSISNYESYELTSGGEYMYIRRIENTLLCVCADERYKEEIENIVDKLGY